MLTDSELNHIKERWTPKTGIYQGTQWPAGTEMITASIQDAVMDLPRLLEEVQRLADELDHWRKRATFAEQFIPISPSITTSDSSADA